MSCLSSFTCYWVSQGLEVSNIFIVESLVLSLHYIYCKIILAPFLWPDSVIVLAKMIYFYGLSCFMIFRVRGWSRFGSPYVSCIMMFILFESKGLITFRIATCLLYYDVWWDMMFDSFSAPFPTWNTHPIRNLVTLLSNAHLHRLLLQRPLVITVHSLRQVHSTGHSEC